MHLESFVNQCSDLKMAQDEHRKKSGIENSQQLTSSEIQLDYFKMKKKELKLSADCHNISVKVLPTDGRLR